MFRQKRHTLRSLLETCFHDHSCIPAFREKPVLPQIVIAPLALTCSGLYPPEYKHNGTNHVEIHDHLPIKPSLPALQPNKAALEELHLQHSQRAEPVEGVDRDAPEPVVTQDAGKGRAESQLCAGLVISLLTQPQISMESHMLKQQEIH